MTSYAHPDPGSILVVDADLDGKRSEPAHLEGCKFDLAKYPYQHHPSCTYLCAKHKTSSPLTVHLKFRLKVGFDHSRVPIFSSNVPGRELGC